MSRLPLCLLWDPHTGDPPPTRRLLVSDLFTTPDRARLMRALTLAVARPETLVILPTEAPWDAARELPWGAAPPPPNLWLLARVHPANVYAAAQEVLPSLRRVGAHAGLWIVGPVREPSLLPRSTFTPTCTRCGSLDIHGGPPVGSPCPFAFEEGVQNVRRLPACTGVTRLPCAWLVVERGGMWGAPLVHQALDARIPVLALDEGPAAAFLPQQWPDEFQPISERMVSA